MNAFLFPGQGSQDVGMGKDLYENLTAAKYILDEAVDILGYDLRELMLNGPIEKLTDTRYAQPAIYTCSAMHLEKAKADGIDYDYVAGHSLGEYSALYAAGVFSFENGLRLVEKRGKAMADQNRKGTMAAVLGLTEEELTTELVPDVVMANLNSKTQIVLSGTETGIEEMTHKLESKGIIVKRLAVSAAFHSPQMQEAKVVMMTEINNLNFNAPIAAVVSNVTGRPTRIVSEIKENLINQITGQVRWYDSINTLVTEGIDQFYEVGHGQVLRKMNRTITLNPRCLSI